MNETVLRILNNVGDLGIKHSEISGLLREHPPTIRYAWNRFKCEDLIADGKAEYVMRGKNKFVRRTERTATLGKAVFPFTPLKEAFKGPKIIRRDAK